MFFIMTLCANNEHKLLIEVNHKKTIFRKNTNLKWSVLLPINDERSEIAEQYPS